MAAMEILLYFLCSSFLAGQGAWALVPCVPSSTLRPSCRVVQFSSAAVMSDDAALSDDDLLPSRESPALAMSDDYEQHPQDSNEHGYVRTGDLTAEVENEGRVHELLMDRVLAKRARDWETADLLKDELLRLHDVRVWDRTREWYVGRFKQQKRLPPQRHDYARAYGDEGAVDESLVDQMLLDRLIAKLQRDFGKADSIRAELKQMGVRVDDLTRTWRSGVAVDQKESWEQPRRPSYSRVPSPDERERHDGQLANEIDAAEVDKLIGDRHDARRKREWAVADEILDKLFSMGVSIDDDSTTWCANALYQQVEVGPGRKRRIDDTTAVSYEVTTHCDAATKEAILDLLNQRRRAKLRRFYDEADVLRYKLNNEFQVAVDDRERAWWFVGGRLPGTADDFDDEAASSGTFLFDDDENEAVDDDAAEEQEENAVAEEADAVLVEEEEGKPEEDDDDVLLVLLPEEEEPVVFALTEDTTSEDDIAAGLESDDIDEAE
mmetsp:Transcript_35674/g.114078  ORF Transcript_35674/g.114078 Transcript_35674/m.114078 type:complete len:493 (-) Transcript_35674:110-1588(-)